MNNPLPARPDTSHSLGQGLSANRLLVAASVFLVLTGNRRFFSELSKAFPPDAGNIAFMASVLLVMVCVLVLLLMPFANRYTLKPALAVLLPVAALTGYFSDTYGTVIDVSMIANAVETDRHEAFDLLNAGLLLRLTALGLVPAFLVYKAPIRFGGWRHELKSRLKLCGLAIAAMPMLALPFSAHYSSLIREYKPVRFFANPAFPLISAVTYLSGSAAGADGGQLTVVGADAHLPANSPHRELMILVVGETARSDHFSLYGYGRDTNPELAKIRDLVVYRDVRSCGTSTAVSVPCMFSQSDRRDFDVKDARHTENALDVLKHAGVSIYWLDNNSSSKGVADRVSYTDFKLPENNPVCDVECRDVGMLSGLQKLIDGSKGDILIVLHQMGSHGPAYYKRYPPEFERFKPACRSSKLSECGKDQIINAYDNSILYTDWFLSKTVELLKRNESAFETMMLYASDHGESLGENGIYLHGAPYPFAPDAQTRIPLLVWQGAFNDVDEASLAAEALKPQSHDALFQTLLNFYEVEGPPVRQDQGLFRIIREQ